MKTTAAVCAHLNIDFGPVAIDRDRRRQQEHTDSREIIHKSDRRCPR